MINDKTLVHFLYWGLFNVMGICLAKLCLLSIPAKPNTSFSKYFMLTSTSSGDRFMISHRNKTNREAYQDISYLFVLSLLHFCFSNLTERFNFNDLTTLYYTIPFFLTIPIMGILGEFKGLQSSISCHSITTWSKCSYITYISSGVCLLANFIANLYYAHTSHHYLYAYATPFMLGLYYLVNYLLYFRQDPQTTLHLHHWWIGNITAFYSQYPYVTGNIMFMILYGICIQGIITHGADSIFLDTSSTDTNLINKENQDKLESLDINC